MKYRTLPAQLVERIKREIETIPMFEGKVSLTLEFNSSTGGVLKEVKVKRYHEDTERL